MSDNKFPAISPILTSRVYNGKFIVPSGKSIFGYYKKCLNSPH